MAQPHDHHHDHGPTGHMHDLEGHVRAVEEDLEYYRTRRLGRGDGKLHVDVHEDWLEPA